MNFSTEKAADVLLQILQMKREKADELAPYAVDEDLLSSDDENDSSCPIFNSYFSIGGADKVLKISSFFPWAIKITYEKFENTILPQWNVWEEKNRNFLLLAYFL